MVSVAPLISLLLRSTRGVFMYRDGLPRAFNTTVRLPRSPVLYWNAWEVPCGIAAKGTTPGADAATSAQRDASIKIAAVFLLLGCRICLSPASRLSVANPRMAKIA